MNRSYSFDQAASYYDQVYGYPAGVEAQAVAAIRAAFALTADERVLEVGVGSGRLAVPLQVAGYRYHGQDIAGAFMHLIAVKLPSPPAPPTGEGRIGVLLTQSDLSALPYQTASFAGALAVQVFHLIPDLAPAIAELQRVLRPDAPLLVVNDGQPDNVDMRGRLTNALSYFLAAEGYVSDERQPAPDKVEAAFVAAGATVETLRPFAWSLTVSPRAFAARLAERQTSKLWHVPEPIFSRALRRFYNWLAADYKGRLDEPFENPRRFVIKRIIFHSKQERIG